MSIIVPPSGSPNSRITIVGERPGREEATAGRGFVGLSGELLWSLLRVPREECYVTNVCKDYKEGNPTPTPAEINDALPSLQREIAQVSSNIIICIGAVALRALTGRSSIDTWRGSILESTLLPGRKCIGVWHTAAALRIYSLRYVINTDLKRAVGQSTFPDIRRPQRTFSINPPLDETISYLRGLEDPAVDIETFGEIPSCIGLSDRPDRAICIPFIGGRYTTTELAHIFRELSTVLRTRKCSGQNFQFDVTRLERLGFRLPNISHDTMLAHHLLWTELGSGARKKSGDRGLDALTGKHSLAFLTSIYTEEPYYKHESDQAWSTPGLELGDRLWRYWTYNCKDAAITKECELGLESELTKYNQREYYNTYVLPLIRPIMRMQDRGLLVDVGTLDKVRRRMQLECTYLQSTLDHSVGFHCNVKSKKDLSYLLHGVLRLPKLKTTKTGQVATDEDTLRRLAYTSNRPEILQLILNIVERRTLLSGFLGLETAPDGTYKASYLIHGTDTGRLSSRAQRKGPQLQNIPRSARKIFISHPGHVFVQGDYSRAEAMFVAYDSQDLDLIELFSDPSRDLYREVAASVMAIPLADVTKVLREIFKRIVHAANYGMGPQKLVVVLRLAGIDILDLQVPGRSRLAKATYVLDAYHRRRQTRKWQNGIKSDLSRTRTLYNSFGRRRVFLGRLDDDSTTRIALAFRPQSSITENANRALRVLDKLGERVVLQVHDSLTIEVPEDQIDEKAALLKSVMLYPMTLHGRTFTIPVDITVGYSWGELHAWTGPGTVLLRPLPPLHGEARIT